MTAFEADVLLLFKYTLAAGLFQFSNTSSSPTDPARGGGKCRNVVAKERDLDTKLAELLAGGPGGSSTARGGSEFLHCFGGMAPAGPGWWGLSCRTRPRHKFVHPVLLVCVVLG